MYVYQEHFLPLFKISFFKSPFMKTRITCFHLHLFLISILLSGCNQTPPKKKHANWVDSSFQSDTLGMDTSHRPNEMCFLRLEGSASKDSTFVNLSILGNKVTGKYSWVPFEKDSKTGSLNGVKKGDTIDVIWQFMQEGVQDTIRTVFLLQKGQLMQKPYQVNPQTGRQFTDDRSAFSISYQKADCTKLP